MNIGGIMKINNVETREDILKFMKLNIKHGWIDIYGEKHINTMKDFRKLYRISSIEETLESGLGTCIEQVNLMNYLCQYIGIKSKMYVTRIYEDENSLNKEDDVYMHCFLLLFEDDKVYHIEHPNFEKIGIYEYSNEEEAINIINQYYINRSGGISRPVTIIGEVPSELSFKEFNVYINNLDKKERNKCYN